MVVMKFWMWDIQFEAGRVLVNWKIGLECPSSIENPVQIRPEEAKFHSS